MSKDRRQSPAFLAALAEQESKLRGELLVALGERQVRDGVTIEMLAEALGRQAAWIRGKLVGPGVISLADSIDIKLAILGEEAAAGTQVAGTELD